MIKRFSHGYGRTALTLLFEDEPDLVGLVAWKFCPSADLIVPISQSMWIDLRYMISHRCFLSHRPAFQKIKSFLMNLGNPPLTFLTIESFKKTLAVVTFPVILLIIQEFVEFD